MFLEKVKSEGLAHLSYIFGDKGEAAVVDPRRDIQVYLDIAKDNNCKITHIFETHRNEDYVIGSLGLQQATGADIHHSENTKFKYGTATREGDQFDAGKLRIHVLETPGHTYDSLSYVLYDTESSEDIPVGVFTGDTLFIGDVGRTDFFPNKKEEVAGLLYDSIFNKILPLGDQTILYPAHGSGSVCGSGMAAREFSTVGIEKFTNPALQKHKKEDFIDHKVNEFHMQPPYFKRMEEYNQNGAPLKEMSDPEPMSAEQFKEEMKKGSLILDIRPPEAVSGAYIPGSLAIPVKMMPAFAGWFIPYDSKIGLVADDAADIKQAVTHLYRIGYDDVSGYLKGGMHSWATTGERYETIPAIHVSDVTEKIKNEEDFVLLDVRSKQEYDSGHLPNAFNIYVGHLPNNLHRLPGKKKPVVTFCGSGRRALIAASILKIHGFKNVENCFGSMAACKSLKCGALVQK